jgi:hypothetical protein
VAGAPLVRALALNDVTRQRADSHLGPSLNPGKPVLALDVARRRQVSGLLSPKSLLSRQYQNSGLPQDVRLINAWKTCASTVSCMERDLVVGAAAGTGVAGALPRMSGNPLFLMAAPLGTVLLIVQENVLHSC